MGKQLMVKMSEYPDIRDELKELAEGYKNLLVTRSTFNEAKKARLRLREKRYLITNIQKSNNSLLNSFKRKNKEMAGGLIGIIFPVEDRIDKKIKDIEKEIEAEKERKRKEKEERIRRQRDLADRILDFMDRCNRADGPREIEGLIDEVDKIKITKKEYGESYSLALKNKERVFDYLRNRYDAVLRAGERKEETKEIAGQIPGEKKKAENKETVEKKETETPVINENKELRPDISKSENKKKTLTIGINPEIIDVFEKDIDVEKTVKHELSLMIQYVMSDWIITLPGAQMGIHPNHLIVDMVVEGIMKNSLV